MKIIMQRNTFTKSEAQSTTQKLPSFKLLCHICMGIRNFNLTQLQAFLYRIYRFTYQIMAIIYR